MRLYRLLMLSSLLLLGAGCFKSPQMSVAPEVLDRQSQTLAGDFPVETLELNGDFVLNNLAGCKVSIKFPDLVGTKADQAMANFIAKTLGSTENLRSTTELAPLLDRHLELCEQEVTAEYAALNAKQTELYINLNRSLDIIYTVSLNQDGLLSFGLDAYAYSGGAHANQNLAYFNLDLNSDRLLKLKDLIKPESLKTFINIEKYRLLTEQSDSLYPERLAEFVALSVNTEAMSAEQQLAAFGDLDNFYLTNEALITYYNPYDLAPYAAGPIFVTIPYAEIVDYILPNSFLSPLLEHAKQL